MRLIGAARGAGARLLAGSSRTAFARAGPSPMPKRFMGHGDVNRNPDLERWNNVRDNIDQVIDFVLKIYPVTRQIWMTTILF